MIRNIALSFFLFLPTLSHAQIDSQFVFNGQNSEVLTAEKAVTVITPEQVEVPHTCTRQVPTGEIRVCRDETRYREECSWVPSREDCRTVYDQVCNPVSRSREVCSGGGSRQQCSPIPTRTVCYERPTSEHCYTTPSGEQRCTTVGGGQNCQEVGGGENCTTVYDSPTCHTEYYTEQSCSSVSRNQCDTVPGYNDCRNIPYSENVCGMEMQYRSESYACTRTITVDREEKKLVKVETNVQINTNGLVEEFPVLVSLKETNAQFKAFTIAVTLQKEPKLFVLLKKKEVVITSATKTEILVKADVTLELLTREMLPLGLPTAVKTATFHKDFDLLDLSFEGPLSPKGNIDLSLSHKETFGRKVIAELKTTFPSAHAEVWTEGKSAIRLKLAHVLKKKPKKGVKVTFLLTTGLNLDGEILNATKPEAKKEFQKIDVTLK